MGWCLVCGGGTPGGASVCARHGGRPSSRHYGAQHQEHRRLLIHPDTRCVLCGRLATPSDPLELDHRVAVAVGGGDGIANKRPIHRSENRKLGGQLGVMMKRRRGGAKLSNPPRRNLSRGFGRNSA